MKKRKWYSAILAIGLTVITVPVIGAPEQGSTQSPSELKALSILKKMSEFLAATGRFSVTIRDGYDVFQESGQKIEFVEVRTVSVSRPDRLRIDVEGSDGQQGLVFFVGKDITIY